ncbi:MULTISPECIES: mobilization protein [unclassified Streptomyces]|uniref:mobilization protein n=1 Tax=Streptomyces sp. NPDC055082 TaxID=3365718 RepID=UPI0037CE0332
MMPKKAEGGSDTAGLLEYLFGPGDRDEHTDPHLVTAWDPDLPCPVTGPGGGTLSELALLLDAPVAALRGPRPAGHVWHVSVRNAPSDRILSDTEWAQVAARVVHAAGVAEHGDEQACRWIAVRHAPDHIHLVATLVRQDGRRPRLRGDIPAMHAAARGFEARWGLVAMSPLDRTAHLRPVTGEAEKAARRGLAETARASLHRTVREAAAQATDDTDFLARLHDAGLRVRERRDDSNTLVGYAVALPGDRADRGSRPVWFSGSTLAYDLSLPRVRERYGPPVTALDWERAGARIREASALLAHAGRSQGSGDVAALGDLLTTAAAHAPGTRSLEGTARAHWRASARALARAPRAARGGGATAVLHLLLALVEAAEAAAAWHRAQEYRAQAGAASRAAELLREAVVLTGEPPSRRTARTPRTAGRGLTPPAPVTGVPPRSRPQAPGTGAGRSR